MREHRELKDEIDFRDLLKKPEKLFGYSYIYFFLVLAVIGLIYAWNLTAVGKNSVMPVALADSSAFAEDIPFKPAQSLPPVDVMKVAQPTPELLARGKELFQGNCSSCHGEDGRGDGSSSATLDPKPRNFHSPQGWVNGPKISEIYKTLEEGIPNSGMASFSYLAPADRFALIHYVRSFASNPPKDTPQELSTLETTYQLSKGRSTPAQIPVKRAMQLIERETRPEIEQLRNLRQQLEKDTNEPGAAVLRSVLLDPDRALTALVLDPRGVPSLDALVRIATTEPRQIGLKGGVAQLTNQQWSDLYRYVKRLEGTAQASM
jgi:mono/diheme cytochrome c family protein